MAIDQQQREQTKKLFISKTTLYFIKKLDAFEKSQNPLIAVITTILEAALTPPWRPPAPPGPRAWAPPQPSRRTSGTRWSSAKCDRYLFMQKQNDSMA